MIIDTNKYDRFFWILLVLFFTSVDTVLFGTNSNKFFLFIPRIMGVIAIVVLPILFSRSIRKIHINLKDLSVLIFLLSIIIISAIINNENFETVISRIITVCLAYAICHSIKYSQYIKIFDHFVFVVSVFALIAEIFTYLFPGIIRILPVIINTSGYSYRVFFLGAVRESYIGSALVRVSGVFWEPGAYAIYLIIAIIFQFFFFEKTNIFKIVFYFLCLILTFSTTGYISLAVLIFTYIISSKSNNVSKKLKILLCVFALFITLFYFFVENASIYSTVFAKLFNGTSSASARYSSLINGMRVALDHPLFGVSSDTRRYMSEYVFAPDSIFKNAGTSITNTFVGQFASYGVVFGSVFVIGTFSFFRKISSKWYEWLLICLTVTLAYMGEKFFSFFPFVFVFYGISTMNSMVSDHENSCY